MPHEQTWDDSHFEIMLRRSMELTPDQTAIVQKCFDETVSTNYVYEAMQSSAFKRYLPYVRYSAIPRG